MSGNYRDLIAQRVALDAQIAQARKIEVEATVERVRSIVREFDLTVGDVFPSTIRKAVSRKGGTVAVKYRDGVTGKTWTGRGKPPGWIKDKDRNQFLIAQ